MVQSCPYGKPGSNRRRWGEETQSKANMRLFPQDNSYYIWSVMFVNGEKKAEGEIKPTPTECDKLCTLSYGESQSLKQESCGRRDVQNSQGLDLARVQRHRHSGAQGLTGACGYKGHKDQGPRMRAINTY